MLSKTGLIFCNGNSNNQDICIYSVAASFCAGFVIVQCNVKLKDWSARISFPFVVRVCLELGIFFSE